MEKLSIKELMEFLNALKILAKFGGAITADGKIGVDDLGHLVAAAKQFQELLDGFQGLDLAMAEAKDLDELEVMTVITEVFAILKEFKEAKAA